MIVALALGWKLAHETCRLHKRPPVLDGCKDGIHVYKLKCEKMKKKMSELGRNFERMAFHRVKEKKRNAVFYPY